MPSFQILTSVSNTTIPDLLPGELAFTQASNSLFIGAPDGQAGNILIGGKNTPGILSNNQALVANSTGGINNVYATNINNYYSNVYFVNSHIVNTDILNVRSLSSNFLRSDTLESNTLTVSGNLSSAAVNTDIITASAATINNISADFVSAYTINNHGIDVVDINIHGMLLANGNHGNVGDILYSSGANNLYWGVLPIDPNVVNTSGNFTLSGNITFANTVKLNGPLFDSDGNTGTNTMYLASTGNNKVQWKELIIDTNTVNTSGSFTLSGNIAFANQITISGPLVDSEGNTGTYTSYLASTGGNTVQWREIFPPYYYSTEMYDYTEYGIGFMNVAPNQNAETLGFRTDISIPFGSIWILAINDGLVDDHPITIYSPSTRTTPMLWMSIDGTGPYSDDNPTGQAYWFNITPPPSGG